MIVMVSVLFSTYVLALLYRLLKDKGRNIQAAYFLILALVIIIGVSAFRTNIGDTSTYAGSYSNIEGRTLAEELEGKGDVGFYLITYYLYQISSNPQFMIFVTAFITQLLYFKFFLQYRSYLDLQVYIYIASGSYFVTMNGIRQSLAAGLVVLSTKYIIENKFKKFLIITLIATMIHQSAIIMIPIYFISRMKPWSKKIFIMIGIAVVGTILFYELLPILEKLLEGTNYQHYIQSFKDNTNDGANSLRVIVALVPVVLAYIRRDYLEDSKCNRVFINLSIINFVFMLFSLQTWVFARFTIYFNMFNFILLPCTICNWKNKKEKKILYILLLICYLVFFLKEQSTAERIRFYF
ncbi:MAG: EpsG family protein [Clostridium sp.]|uniref:EpsG family protein n=1 Tax=Clostridium sp. TaxID=1506 RepID=UPI003F359E77